MSTISLESATSGFTSRGASFRRVDATGPCLKIRVFQATQAPEFFAFTRDGQTLYESALSFEAAPVYTAFSTVANGRAEAAKREELRRAANWSASARQRVYDPTFLEHLNGEQTLTLNDLQLARYAPYRIGERVNAFWNQTSGRWEILAPPEFNVVRFQLETALTSGSTATAAALYFDATTQTFVDGGLKINVADFLGRFQGAVGARGYARRFADRDAWEVFALDA